MANTEEFWRWFRELCSGTGREAVVTEEICRALEKSSGIRKEIQYYFRTQEFLCEYRVQGYSLIDIMIWQMDHFKAWLDRGNAMIKGDGNRMLLEAAVTMLEMERDPAPYVEKMGRETGTDYPDKFR
ncbi:MAG: hypothetical protein HDR26_09755 [Lachnospiraceae bacterium]|nr:hypothetical protein [Lachnospiraceae bacterium]